MSQISQTKSQLDELLGNDGYILIIDPTEAGRMLIKGFFDKIGNSNYKTASSVAEAKRIMLTTKVRLFVAEWLMDNQNGIQFCRELRNIEQYQSSPFMLVSSGNLSSDVILASEVNIDRYLLKPFSFDTFNSQIAALCKTALNPTEYETLVKNGNLAILQKNLSKAQENFDKAASLEPKSATPILGKAKIELYRKNVDSAQLLVENALKLNRKFVEAHRLLLKIYQVKENMDGVYKEAEYLNQMSPENPLYLLILAEKAINESNFAKAESYYKNVVLTSPKVAQAHKGLGDIAFAKDEFDKAEKHYKKAIDLEPNDISALNQLGLTFVKKNLVREGLQMYMTGLKIDPTNPKILFNMGKAYEEIEMQKEAYDCYLNALTEAPGFKKAQRAVARLEKLINTQKAP